MKKIADWQGGDIRIGIATDHGGFEMKKKILAFLSSKKITAVDYGPCCLDQNDDYSDFAGKIGIALTKGEINCAILICRSGIGMAMNANRFHNVRAGVAYDEKLASVSRLHNFSNVLVLPGDYMDADKAMRIVETWLATPFGGDERHVRRLDKMENNSWDAIAPVRKADPVLAEMLDKEYERERSGIELIASENFASASVMAAQGTVLTNKYAEGYPSKRYYNGCEVVDEIESLAIERACKLFGAEAANVQPHSGSQANMAAYFAVADPGKGETILAMDLAHGGHLTHGHPLNFSGMLYNIVPYGVDRETEVLNYDEIERLAKEHRPKIIVAGASAYPRTLDFPRLRAIADMVDAKLIVDMAHIAGLVAAGEHPSPVPYADIVTSTTHKTLRGPRSGLIVCKEQYIKAVNSKLFPGIQGGPMMHTIAAKAACFGEALTEDFKIYQRQIRKNATKLADELARLGFRIVSGGTDNHLMLVDLRPKKSTGKDAATSLDKARITVNKNMIPFDPEKPFVTSGIRIGTPAVTTRGMKEPEMLRIAAWIDKCLMNKDNEQLLKRIGNEIKEFSAGFPMPGFLCRR